MRSLINTRLSKRDSVDVACIKTSDRGDSQLFVARSASSQLQIYFVITMSCKLSTNPSQSPKMALGGANYRVFGESIIDSGVNMNIFMD